MKVTGYIVSEKTNLPIEYISLVALDSAGNLTTNGTTTNELGEFEINIEPSQEIIIKGIGYEDKIIAPTDGQIILLKSKSYNIPEVVITETRSVINEPQKNWWKPVVVLVVAGVVIYLIVKYYK